MLYREVGQYKTNYAADMAVFPILQDRIGIAVILLVAFVVLPLIGNDFLLNTKNYVVQFDASTWGWTHMILGVVVAATGLFILTGNRLARGVGVAIVSLSALANFLWIPYYPLWAMTVLALDVAVIWALTNANLGDS